jgi:hypothetical protein
VIEKMLFSRLFHRGARDPLAGRSAEEEDRSVQLTTLLHLLALLVPIVVLAVFDLMHIVPSNALLGALGTMSAYAGVSSVVGYTKDRIALRESNSTPKRRRSRRSGPLPAAEAKGGP